MQPIDRTHLAAGSTAALAAVDWPRTERAAFARVFLLAFGAES